VIHYHQIVQSAKAAVKVGLLKGTKKTLKATAKVFRTAYECAQSHLLFTKHHRLIALQTLNDTECGNILYFNLACGNIVAHISSKMQSQIVNYIVQRSEKISLLVVTVLLLRIYALWLFIFKPN